MLFPRDLDELIESLISGMMVFVFTALSFNNFLYISRMYRNSFYGFSDFPLVLLQYFFIKPH